jgi:hypothetical protein
MKEREDLIVHYWQLPHNLFISLKTEFHAKFCLLIQHKLNDKRKNCFHKILNCPKWHAQRLFAQSNRMTINELEVLREYTNITKEEIESNINSIGCHEDRAIINNPNLPFQLKDLVYVASHLMFDGSYRDKRGGYFYAYEPSLVEYHKKRLGVFGDVPINFIEEENQLYFVYTIGYIAKKVLEIDNFNSKKCFLSNRLKELAKQNKIIIDEIVKALIIDEGNIEDKIEVELTNERLIKDLYEVINQYYPLSRITSRIRDIDFKAKPEWKYKSSVWNLNFSAKSFQDLYKSLFSIPISYKEDNLRFLFDRQNRSFNQRKLGETKRLIVTSLLQSPKTMEELAKKLLVKQTTIRAHLKGHPTYKDSLMKLGIVDRIDEKILRRGGYAKVGVYGIKDVNKAQKFLNN